jgi:hypothetical protein
MQTVAAGCPGGTEGAVAGTVAPFGFRALNPFITHNTLSRDSLFPGLLKKAQMQGSRWTFSAAR